MSIECGQILGLKYPVDCTENGPDKVRLPAAVRENEYALIPPKERIKDRTWETAESEPRA